MGAATHGFERASADFAPMMEDVARRFFGEPNRAFSKGDRLRFGSKGSIEVDRRDGWFANYEADVRGGVLDLIMHQQRCDKRGALEWLTSEGLLEAEPVNRPRFGGTDGKPGSSTFYDYADADGVVAYRVERRGKDQVPRFLQHGPDGRGGFHAGKGCMQGVARLPYRLPELLAAPTDAIVFVVEGEKDADRLAALGLVATTNSEGAGKFRAELAPHFAGRHVTIIPDNDQAGRDHAEDVAGKLAGVAAVVVTVELPNLPAKGDVSDALDRGLTADALHALAAAALTTAAEQARPDTFPIADLSAWATTAPEPKAFLMAGCVPLGEVTLFTGAGGTNKSTFGLQLCAASAAGLPMLGAAVQPGSALYVTAEDEDRENHWRLTKIAHALRTDLHRLAGRLHVVSLRGRLNNELATFDAEGRLHAAPAYKLLRATIEATGSRLVVLDNVAHLFTGNENDRGQVTAFVNLLYQLCRDLGCTIVLIGHPNKAGDTYSGSTAWLNAVRSQIVLGRPEDSIDPDQRVLTLGKANYARADQQITFRWHDFALVRDDDLPAGVGEELAANIQANHENERFLQCLAKATEEKRATSPNRTASNYAPRIFAGMTTGKGVSERGFELAMERLLHLGTIANAVKLYQRDNRAWVTGLGLAPTPAPTMHQPAHQTCTDPHSDQKENLHQPARTHPLSPTGITGAAFWAAPPVTEEAGSRRHGDPILAPGESIDDPVPGWDDSPW